MAVWLYRYHKHRVFAGLANGTVAVFDPQQPSAGHTHLIHVSSAPITSCVSLGDQLLVSSEARLYAINPATMEARVSVLPLPFSLPSLSPASLPTHSPLHTLSSPPHSLPLSLSPASTVTARGPADPVCGGCWLGERGEGVGECER